MCEGFFKGVIMLVLSRKKDEKILIRTPLGEEVEITIVNIDGRNRVRLGVNADKNIVVLRSELLETNLPAKQK